MCQATFNVAGEPIDAREFKFPEANQTGGRNWKGMIKLVLFCLLIIVASVAVFLLKNKKKPRREISSTNWRSPYVFSYYAFNGSKGPVIWEIMKQNSKDDDGSVYFLRVIDPIANKLITETEMDITDKKDPKEFSSRLYYKFLQSGDTLFNGSEVGGLQAFGLYSGKRLLDNESAQQFLHMGSPIANVKTVSWQSEFEITDSSGNDYFFSPELHYFLDVKQKKLREINDTVKRRGFCVTREKKAALYLVTRTGRSGDFLEEFEMESFNGGSDYLLSSMKRLGDKFYPYPMMLSVSSDVCVIAYLSGYSPEAALVIEKIDANGGTIWKSEDPELQLVKKKVYGDNLDLDYKINNNVLTIYNSDIEDNSSVGIDLSNGKKLFTHFQSKRLN
jgi:hypothetical protein